MLLARHRRVLRVLLLVWVVAVLACRPGTDPDGAGRSGTLLLVGIDGLDWSVCLSLIRDGRMPHLERLMQRGSYGRLRTIAPARSPVIWTSVATGRRPAEHGIVDFTWDDAAGVKRLFTSADRRTKALWDIVSDSGRRVIAVSWWNSFPVDPVEGVLVAQANTLEHIAKRRLLKPGGMLRGVPGQVHPPERQDEMLGVVEAVDGEMPALLEQIFGGIGRAERPGDRANLEACAWSVRADESTRRIALRLASEQPRADLFAVYLGTPDVVSHRFWRFHDPDSFRHPPLPDAIEQFGDVVNDAYERADASLGELIDALGEDTTILVLSDHGMHAHNTDSRFDAPVDGRLERESGGHEDGPPGVFVAAGPGIRRLPTGRPITELTPEQIPDIGHVLDITPTVLTLLGIPIGRDMAGRVLFGLLAGEDEIDYVATHDDADWRARRGFALPDVPGAAERLEQLRSLGYIESSPQADPGH